MAYGYYGTITIDAGKVSGSSNLTDFPVLINGTYDGTGGEPDIRTAANGGKVQNTASGGASGSYTIPADLVFSPNTDGSSPYDFEIESYNAATGAIVAWVEVSTLDYDDNTVLYMVYGDSGVSTSQEDVSGTWDGSYSAVYHLADLYDSKGSNDLTNSNSAVFASGIIGNGIDIERSNNQMLYVNASLLSANSAATLSGWSKQESAPTSGSDWMHPFGTGKTDTYGLNVLINNTDNSLYSFVTASSTQDTGDNLTTGTAYYITQVYTGTKNKMYLNSTDTLDASYSSGYAAPDFFRIGRSPYGSFPWQYDGIVDEVRISTIARSADWIVTDYNTQSSPATFYTMGSETSLGGATAIKDIIGGGFVMFPR